MHGNRLRIALLLLILATVAYYLPWGHHINAATSPGARDLAEWTTIQPASMLTSPPLLPSLLLRGAFAGLPVLLSLFAVDVTRRAARLGLLVVAFALVGTLFPPLDYLTVARDNLNYGQQFTWFAVSGAAVLALGMTAWRAPVLARLGAGAVLSAAVMVSGMAGLNQALSIMNARGMGISVGLGAILFAIALGLLTVTELDMLRKTRA